MLEKIKEHMLGTVIAIVVTVFGFLLYLTMEKIIEKYISPVTISLLKNKGYQTDIKNDVNNFSKQVESLSIKQQRLLDELSIYDTKISDLEYEVTEVKKENSGQKIRIEELTLLIDSKATNTLQVKLFISKKHVDRNYLILNSKNYGIKHLINNSQKYEVCSALGKCINLIVRVEPASDLKSNKPKEAVGRIYFNDYHKLFNGRKSGSDNAIIKLKDEN